MDKEKNKSKISSGVKVGLIAIAINVITVMVYIYQANLMQMQQHASVWPHIEWKTSYLESERFVLTVSNNGIGPALINTVTMRVDGVVQNNLDSLFSSLLGTNRFPHIRDAVQNRVLPANQSIKLFETQDAQWAELLYHRLQKVDFQMEICYESIYQYSWLSKGVDVVETARCD